MRAQSKIVMLLAAAAVVAAGAAYAYFGMGWWRSTTFGALSNYVIVQSRGAPELTLVDTRDDTVAGRIELPAQPDQIIVSDAMSRIIYSNRANRTLSIYDLATQSVETTIELAFSPEEIVLDPNGVTVAVTDPGAGVVGIVKLTENALFETIDGLNFPANVAFDNAGEYLFVSDSETGNLQVIDALSGLLLDPVQLSLGGSAHPDALSPVTRTPNGLFGLAVNRESGLMSIINFRAWEEIETLQMGASPIRPYGTADGMYMLVANNDDRTVSVVSTEFMQVEATLPGVSDVTSIATGFFETLAFVVSSAENKAAIIDLTEMDTIGEIELDSAPGPAIADADGLKMYVALSGTNELAVIDIQNKRLLTTIPNVGDRPWEVAMAVTNNYCH